VPVAVDPYPTHVLPCLTNPSGAQARGARHLAVPTIGLGAQVIDLACATQQNSRALEVPPAFSWWARSSIPIAGHSVPVAVRRNPSCPSGVQSA
jgi:hypothetical protein